MSLSGALSSIRRKIQGQFLLLNARGIVLDNAFFRLSTSLSVLETFAVKVESCSKSRLILDVFCPLKF